MSISARTGPPPKCTVRSSRRTSLPFLSSTRATMRLSPSVRSTARHLLTATVPGPFTSTPSKPSGSAFLPFTRELDRLPRQMLDRDLGNRDWRSGVGERRQPRVSGTELFDVDDHAHAELVGHRLVARGARCFGTRTTQHHARDGDVFRRRAVLHEFERRIGFESRAFDHDVDATIRGETCGILALIERLVRAASDDLHARRRNVQRDCEVVGHRLCTRLRQRVVVGEHLSAAAGDLLRVRMAHGTDADVARATPGIDERAKRLLVGGQQLGLEHVEARRERELRAAVDRRAARELRLDRRGAQARLRRENRTLRSRAPSMRRRRWPLHVCGTGPCAQSRAEVHPIAS